MQITVSGFNIFRCDSEEAIKSYGYPITKVKLEKAVMNAIQNNPNIYLYTGEIVVKQYPFRTRKIRFLTVPILLNKGSFVIR